MSLNIDTFSNAVGGNAFYKAATHPLAAVPARELVAALRANGPVAVYDPHNFLAAFDAIYPLERIELAGLVVQDLAQVGRVFRNHAARPITELKASRAATVLIAGFDTAQTAANIKPLMKNGASLLSFDRLR